MSRTLIRFSIPLIGSAAVALGMFACSSDSPAPAAGTGGGTSTGGATTSTGGGSSAGGKSGTGGTTSTGGKASTGGASGSTADSPLYECQKAPPRDPGGTVAKDAACCGGLGKCVDPASITDPKMKASLGHETCLPTLKCAPPASTGDAGAYAKCTATSLAAGLEGRCLPKCFVLGNPQVDQLKADGCTGTGVVCAPCYNPMDATDTGACSQNGDAPDATKKPAPYAHCGAFDGGSLGGLCVPKAVVDASGDPSAPNLKQDDCPSATDRCSPALKVKDAHACFEKCTTTLTPLNTPGFDYSPGACVPSYIVRDVAPAGLPILKKDTCLGADELCAPCLNPQSMPTSGDPSHSCEAPPAAKP